MTVFGRDSLLTVVDGAAGRPRPRPRGPPDPGPVPGQGGRPAARRGARPHPPRDALRRRRRRCRSAEGASTTARPTPPRSSSCCSARCGAGASPARWSTSCCPTRTGPSSGSSSFGDLDGDGYVEYQRATDRGLANQGWKDSWDGIRYGDGTRRRGPDRPVRGAGVRLRRLPGPAPTSPSRSGDDRHLRPLPGQGDPARRRRSTATSGSRTRAGSPSGLDADKRPIDSLTSNMGHCLWTGIVDEDKARRRGRAAGVAGDVQRLGRPHPVHVDSGGYNPISYHCGSVWPHDTAIVAAGLARYGFDGAAQQLIFALLDAAVSPGRPAARAVQRPRPRGARRAGRLPDVVLAPGVGGGVAAAVPADPAAARSVGPLRQDLAVPEPSRGDRLPQGGGDPAGRVAGDRRGRLRGRRWGGGRAASPRRSS